MSAFTMALSAALVDFLWQGAIVGLLLWLALAALRSRSAHTRYAAACGALVVLAILPVVTIAAVWAMAADTPPVAAVLPSQPVPAAGPRTMLQIWFVPEQPRMLWLEQLQAWTLPVWSLGVLLLSIRLASGYARSRALRRGSPAHDEPAVAIADRLAKRLGITRPIRVLTSTIADGPGVIGWLRPVILLPPATAMGLSPQQLEAVLAHELAHVRRHDYLVNVLQIVAETLFFYHPVVWWVSRQIRTERELCCDDVAVRSCGDAVGYARALTILARNRLHATGLAMGATGGSLTHRVQRLLGETPRELEPSGAPGLIVLGVALAAIVLNLDRLQALAQPSPAETVRFEVASIKRNTLNDMIVVIQSQNNRFMARGYTVQMLIQAAYRVQEFQVAGGPDWIGTDRFDIEATEPPDPGGQRSTVAPGPGLPSRRDLMLRALLEERFNLAVHKETQERPVFALVLARSDGRLGPQFRPATVDCATATGDDACGTNVGPGYIRVRGVTMPQLATSFSRLTMTGSSLNRLVVDRTGLDGRFNADLKFTPENIPTLPPDSPLKLPTIDPNGPSVFTAVQEQLGLKLDAQRGPVEVLVIDRVDRPTEN